MSLLSELTNLMTTEELLSLAARARDQKTSRELRMYLRLCLDTRSSLESDD